MRAPEGMNARLMLSYVAAGKLEIWEARGTVSAVFVIGVVPKTQMWHMCYVGGVGVIAGIKEFWQAMMKMAAKRGLRGVSAHAQDEKKLRVFKKVPGIQHAFDEKEGSWMVWKEVPVWEP